MRNFMGVISFTLGRLFDLCWFRIFQVSEAFPLFSSFPYSLFYLLEVPGWETDSPQWIPGPACVRELSQSKRSNAPEISYRLDADVLVSPWETSSMHVFPDKGLAYPGALLYR